MAFSVSLHYGHQVSRNHNIRRADAIKNQKHIDKDGYYEIWKDIPVRDAYEELFSEAVREYNGRQKRSGRKIKSYYDQICGREKMHPAYEMILAIGNRENCPDQELARAAMFDFVKEWNGRNPHLFLIGAYYHADETIDGGIPHVHIDYIPWADNYKKGMSVQTGLVRALGQQGFVGNASLTAQTKWQQLERRIFKEICLRHGLEIKDMNIGRNHIETDLYKAKEEHTRINNAIREGKEEQMKIGNAVRKANEELNNINSCLVGVRTEYDVKAAYVRETDKMSQISYMYPEEAKLVKRGKYVQVPKEMWEARHVSANEKQYLNTATGELERKIEAFKELSSTRFMMDIKRKYDKQKEDVQRIIQEKNELQNELSNLREEIQEMKEFMQQYSIGEHSLLEEFEEEQKRHWNQDRDW